jgi:pilus assembly protein CpaB
LGVKLSSGMLAILIAFLAAALSAAGHLSYLKGLRKTATVVVVSKDVAAFQRFDQSVLSYREMPAGAVPPDAVTSIKEAVGQYSRTLLIAGDVVRKPYLMEASKGSMAARLTEAGDPNVRAMAVRVSAETGVASTLQPGDTVDVLVALQVEGNTVSKIIAQGVPVLFTSFKPLAGEERNVQEGTVVLQVLPALAEELAFAQNSGTIWLLTMPYVASDHQTRGVNLRSFQEQYPIMTPQGNKRG